MEGRTADRLAPPADSGPGNQHTEAKMRTQEADKTANGKLVNHQAAQWGHAGRRDRSSRGTQMSAKKSAPAETAEGGPLPYRDLHASTRARKTQHKRYDAETTNNKFRVQSTNGSIGQHRKRDPKGKECKQGTYDVSVS